MKELDGYKESNCLIDDLRFRNELDGLKKRKEQWITVRLTIDPEEQLRRMKETYPDKWEEHWSNRDNVSEVDLDGSIDEFDFEFDAKMETEKMIGIIMLSF